jgi:hypothetical protein
VLLVNGVQEGEKVVDKRRVRGMGEPVWRYKWKEGRKQGVMHKGWRKVAGELGKA